MTDTYNLSDIAYLSSLGSPSFETEDEEVAAQSQSMPEWPVPNHGTYTHVYIPQRSPQLQSVEELQHRRRMQSVSAQTPHIIPAGIVEASYASSPSASPSSLTSTSSSCQMQEIQRAFDSVWEKQIWQEVPRCAGAQAPVQIPSYVTEYPVNNNDFEQYSSPPSSSGSSPSYSPPSFSSPSSAGYSSPSPSRSHAAFTPPPQSAPYMYPPPSSGSFQTMDLSQTFIHPDRIGGPSTSAYNSAYDHSPPLHTMNMGYNYSPIPPTSAAPAQYPKDENTRRHNNFNGRYSENTKAWAHHTGYPQDLNTDPSNFGYPHSQYPPQPQYSPPP